MKESKWYVGDLDILSFKETVVREMPPIESNNHIDAQDCVYVYFYTPEE